MTLGNVWATHRNPSFACLRNDEWLTIIMYSTGNNSMWGVWECVALFTLCHRIYQGQRLTGKHSSFLVLFAVQCKFIASLSCNVKYEAWRFWSVYLLQMTAQVICNEKLILRFKNVRIHATKQICGPCKIEDIFKFHTVPWWKDLYGINLQRAGSWGHGQLCRSTASVTLPDFSPPSHGPCGVRFQPNVLWVS